MKPFCWVSVIERSCTVKGKKERIEMDLVWVRKGIVLWNKMKMLRDSVWVWFLVQVLRLHLRSLWVRCCCCYCQVQGQSIVLFGLSWCHLFKSLVYAGWIFGVRLGVYSFVRTLGNYTSFHSQQLSSKFWALVQLLLTGKVWKRKRSEGKFSRVNYCISC